MNKYLITTKREYTTGIALAPKSYIETNGEHDYEDWREIDGEMFISIEDTSTPEKAVEMASFNSGLDRVLLVAELIYENI